LFGPLRGRVESALEVCNLLSEFCDFRIGRVAFDRKFFHSLLGLFGFFIGRGEFAREPGVFALALVKFGLEPFVFGLEAFNLLRELVGSLDGHVACSIGRGEIFLGRSELAFEAFDFVSER
jgi:hypothetical protein